MRARIGRPLIALVLGLGLALACVWLLSTASARAAPAGSIITVTTTDDELNGDDHCSLREAIQAANTDAAVSGCTGGSGRRHADECTHARHDRQL